MVHPRKNIKNDLHCHANVIQVYLDKTKLEKQDLLINAVVVGTFGWPTVFDIQLCWRICEFYNCNFVIRCVSMILTQNTCVTTEITFVRS